MRLHPRSRIVFQPDPARRFRARIPVSAFLFPSLMGSLHLESLVPNLFTNASIRNRHLLSPPLNPVPSVIVLCSQLI